QPAGFHEHISKVVVRLGIVWSHRLGFGINRNCFFKLALFAECISPVVICLGIARMDRNGALIALDGFGELALVVQSCSEMVVSVRHTGLQGYGFPIAILFVFISRQLTERGPKVEM